MLFSKKSMNSVSTQTTPSLQARRLDVDDYDDKSRTPSKRFMDTYPTLQVKITKRTPTVVDATQKSVGSFLNRLDESDQKISETVIYRPMTRKRNQSKTDSIKSPRSEPVSGLIIPETQSPDVSLPRSSRSPKKNLSTIALVDDPIEMAMEDQTQPHLDVTHRSPHVTGPSETSRISRHANESLVEMVELDEQPVIERPVRVRRSSPSKKAIPERNNEPNISLGVKRRKELDSLNEEIKLVLNPPKDGRRRSDRLREKRLRVLQQRRDDLLAIIRFHEIKKKRKQEFHVDLKNVTLRRTNPGYMDQKKRVRESRAH